LSQYFLFEQKIELLYFKPIQLQKLASQLSTSNRRFSSDGKAPAQHARGTNDKAKTFVQLTATTPFEGEGAQGREFDPHTDQENIFLIFVTWIEKHF